MDHGDLKVSGSRKYKENLSKIFPNSPGADI